MSDSWSDTERDMYKVTGVSGSGYTVKWDEDEDFIFTDVEGYNFEDLLFSRDRLVEFVMFARYALDHLGKEVN